MKAVDIDGIEVKIGDIVEIADNPKPHHKWLHEGNKLRVVSIEDRSFQDEKEFPVLFFETLKGGRKLYQGLRASWTRKKGAGTSR